MSWKWGDNRRRKDYINAQISILSDLLIEKGTTPIIWEGILNQYFIKVSQTIQLIIFKILYLFL